MNIIHCLLVGVGGMIGAMSRYIISTLMHADLSKGHLPWMTLAVNVLGCLMIGLVAEFLKHPAADSWRFLLIAGFLGGFTTFSAFGMETMTLWQHGYPWTAAVNVSISVIGGFLAVGVGLMGAKFFSSLF